MPKDALVFLYNTTVGSFLVAWSVERLAVGSPQQRGKIHTTVFGIIHWHYLLFHFCLALAADPYTREILGSGWRVLGLELELDTNPLVGSFSKMRTFDRLFLRTSLFVPREI
jgi:hypothetical protein